MFYCYVVTLKGNQNFIQLTRNWFQLKFGFIVSHVLDCTQENCIKPTLL